MDKYSRPTTKQLIFDMDSFWHLVWAKLMFCKFSLFLIPLYIFLIYNVSINKVLQGCIVNKSPGPLIGQSEICHWPNMSYMRSQIIFITLFYQPHQTVSMRMSKIIFLSQTGHVLTFLHPVWMFRVTYIVCMNKMNKYPFVMATYLNHV